ncbi:MULTISPECIES: Rne/Rng family ribonuclease [unclassified Paenibacillus]|uniref:Rne/Rng family ribonuclease n=1 Tax=unclassified Paenibacillus TaxID=185978 RepID=UPI00095654DA|nr:MULTISPECIES: Rne/Rng family ribonuclease [unclassified Paenibacillus]ASS66324.1 Rne/Rng family ribonuclease [Paenibacillus sp. RUD330]SIQ07820.1 ribonuclease G [Paenibacillus sp. RU4X]SIQ27917.1 ribonuclease G [Paenibacillus sp. RU4T]
MRTMLIQANGALLQTAVLQGGRVMEFFMEDASEGGLVGNMYKGRVVNVLPGMQAAFVDIGLAKNAFLYIDELLHPAADHGKDKPAIADLVRVGQELLVQVIKEPIGGKGARVTTQFSLPGRWLVYMPGADYVGVSKKIGAESERSRLRGVGEELRRGSEGIILRTVAAGENLHSLRHDLMQLRESWEAVVKKAKGLKSPQPVLREAALMRRTFRDAFTPGTEVYFDDRSRYEEALKLVHELAPGSEARLHLADKQGGKTLFEQHGVAEQLSAAFQTRIWLPSGGYLVWEQTEALTVIDVNTGKFTGTSGLEDTVFRTNMEAAREIARLLRLRDVGGIIIVDFIDMEDGIHREKVRHQLEDASRDDRSKCQVHGWTRLGLLEITRKKTRKSIGPKFHEICGSCGGSGQRYVGLSPRAKGGQDGRAST